MKTAGFHFGCTTSSPLV